MILDLDQRDDRDRNAHLDAGTVTRALHAANNLVVITDASQPDNPIVWVNDYFCEFTGYDRSEVIGRNCRFLQGDDRDQAERYALRDAVDEGHKTHVLIRNYRKDGTLFYNDLYISPVFEDGRPRYFIGVQNDVSARVRAVAQAEDQERQIHETAENERERFGMDLHDGLGQTLAGATMLSHALTKDLMAFSEVDGPLSALPSEVLAKVRDLAQHAENLHRHVERTVGEARDMAYGLNPIDATPTGLPDALNRLADRNRSDDGPKIVVRVEDVSFRDRRQARHLYRIAQEALSNALRHADASEIRITLTRTGSGILLEVGDDGIGLAAAEKLRFSGSDSEGRGLHSIHYRADLIGAKADVGESVKGGTLVRLMLPDDATSPAEHQRVAES
ncbi:MAG: PAS domain-containing protein [Bacteroidota bacterium]